MHQEGEALPVKLEQYLGVYNIDVEIKANNIGFMGGNEGSGIIVIRFPSYA